MSSTFSLDREFMQRLVVLSMWSIMVSACGASFISVEGRLKVGKAIPYDENMLLAKLDNNSIATISDDPRGTLDHHLTLYDDTLGLQWSAFLPVDREHIIEPLWLSRSADGISLIYKRNEDGDSITIAGSTFDRTTGKEKESVILKGVSFDTPRHSTIRPPQLIASPDSSKFLIYQVDETELKEKTENESLIVHADVFDMNLKKLASGTLRTKMDRDVEGRAEETTKLFSVQIGNDGRVYQFTGHGHSTIQMMQWDVSSGNQHVARWTIEGEDLREEDSKVRSIQVRMTPAGTIIVAAPLVSNSSLTDTELLGVAIAGFEPGRSTPTFTSRYDLTEERIEQLTDDDELEFYYLTDLVYDPSTGTSILPFEHERDESRRDKSGFMNYVFVHENLVVLAFDRQGKPIWQQYVEIPRMIFGGTGFIGTWWKVDAGEAHYIYRNEDEDALMVGRFSTATGEPLPAITIATTDMTPWHSSSTWLGGNNGIIRLGTRDDAHLVRIGY